MNNSIPLDIYQKISQRQKYKKAGNYLSADKIRKEIETQGYRITDMPNGETDISQIITTKNYPDKPGKIAVFGSGELSSVGRSIHEKLIDKFTAPVKIALLETPAGYEDDPHNWYKKLKSVMEKGLVNYRPEINLVPALRNDGDLSTNNQTLLEPLVNADYIHSGAGSPTYAGKHLKNSLALKIMEEHLLKGGSLSIASACSIAFGKYILPVYEIYFAGFDPFWQEGLDFFKKWGLNLTFIPHWNNREGGDGIDTRFSYIGKKRFDKLLQILPGPTNIIGIDEQTAVIFDIKKKQFYISGKGQAHLINKSREILFQKNQIYDFELLNI